MEIQVTWDDINNGKAVSVTDCAIARAVLRQHPNAWRVWASTQGITVWKKGPIPFAPMLFARPVEYSVSGKVARWIVDFDISKGVGPVLDLLRKSNLGLFEPVKPIAFDLVPA